MVIDPDKFISLCTSYIPFFLVFQFELKTLPICFLLELYTSLVFHNHADRKMWINRV